MADMLWNWDELTKASGGSADGTPSATITGFSIDSRDIRPGEVFVALKDQRDGHDFVTAAFGAGAAAALVSNAYQRKPGDGALLRVGDVLAGLESIGRAARARMAGDSLVVAVTGSAGKTGTKEMLRACFSRLGPTHAPEKSFNNHWGVPLTLARMPATTRFAVLEVGMNHAGEIRPLTKLVRPHVAIITNVLPVHLGHFASVEEIADAKAEIVEGLEAGGTAVLNLDNPHFERLAAAARSHGAEIVSFGRRDGAGVHLLRAILEPDHSELEVDCSGGRIVYKVGAPGEHIAANSLAVVAALEAEGLLFEDLLHALRGLATTSAPAGRGQREVLEGAIGRVLLIDESYNANPASMAAALAAMALVPRESYGRRVAVLGDMLELGDRADELHAGLKDAIDAAGIDLVFAAGPHMRELFESLDEQKRGAWAKTAHDLQSALFQGIRGGDAVMIKGSLGSRMGPLVGEMKRRVASHP